jgi:hypothetical protein
VLTGSEIAAWLMFHGYSGIGRSQHESARFTLFADDHLSWYGQSKDVWDTHAMLSRVRLMTSETSEYQPCLAATGRAGTAPSPGHR